MNTKKLPIVVMLISSLIAGSVFAAEPALYLELADAFNSPASADLDKENNIYQVDTEQTLQRLTDDIMPDFSGPDFAE